MTVSPPPATATSILGLSHVGVMAADIERSCAFYRDFLGFAEHCRLKYLTTGELMLVCFKINDDQWIEVFTGLQPGEHRMHQVAFRVADAEQIRACLAARDFAVPEKTPTGQMGNLNFVVPDPSGQIIEFVQHLPTGIIERDRGKFLPVNRIYRHLRHARIAVRKFAADEAFYDPIGLAAVEGTKSPGRPSPALIRRTPLGDVVEFVVDPESQAQFTLEVVDIDQALETMDRSPCRPGYLRPLNRQFSPDGIPFLDVFDPDGTCVRLMEPALAPAR